MKLENRYIVTKADGSPVDPDAYYLVLRLDPKGSDKVWTHLCRITASFLCGKLVSQPSRPDLAELGNELGLQVNKLAAEACTQD